MSTEIKAELARLSEELEEIRLSITNCQEEKTNREFVEPPNEHQNLNSKAVIAVTTSTPLENLQRLLEKSRGDE